MKEKRANEASRRLRGWQEIAAFLGQPVEVAQRWGRSGMPTRREGRYVVADSAELSQWLGREAHLAAPAQIASERSDLMADLRKSLQLRKRK